MLFWEILRHLSGQKFNPRKVRREGFRRQGRPKFGPSYRSDRSAAQRRLERHTSTGRCYTEMEKKIQAREDERRHVRQRLVGCLPHTSYSLHMLTCPPAVLARVTTARVFSSPYTAGRRSDVPGGGMVCTHTAEYRRHAARSLLTAPSSAHAFSSGTRRELLLGGSSVLNRPS
ncbi:uncharacterized protein LOC144917623 isoform X1 [Branchiostoma floridae x Branchiostoma belcheri]